MQPGCPIKPVSPLHESMAFSGPGTLTSVALPKKIDPEIVVRAIGGPRSPNPRLLASVQFLSVTTGVFEVPPTELASTPEPWFAAKRHDCASIAAPPLSALRCTPPPAFWITRQRTRSAEAIAPDWNVPPAPAT